MTPQIGVSNAKNFATKFFGSEMTPSPPFGTFPKIHRYWYRQASLISVNESRPYVEVIVCICLVQVHIIIILSSSIWFAALLAKKAINIKNQGSYLEVIFQTYLNYLIESDL